MMVWVLLPAFNEEDSLPRLFLKIDEVFTSCGFKYRIVVVNDGSTDNTRDIVEAYIGKYPIDIVNHSINRGLGETERDGFEYIVGRCDDEDAVIRLDCDDTHDPKYFLDLLKKINEGYDVVISSRFRPGGGQIGVDAYRAVISWGANIFMKLVFNICGVRDYSCGFRAYRGKTLKYAVKIFGNGFIQLKGLGFTSTLETIVKLKLLGSTFAEIPFMLRYDRKVGYSKMITSLTTLGYFIMAMLYHWPFGGWRISYRDLARSFHESPERTVSTFRAHVQKRSLMCRIGGG
ncbi:MAG: glycosyltransferase family 2 protein [Candidatus Tectomicrobia bacterium]|nr:glycosyltransferase family 2 protein [Candidatus Tectomicrobia bacterium]